MVGEGKERVCPVSLHKSFDNKLRKLIHNPKKILKDYIKEGDTAIDFGCGPGFFTLTMAELAGSRGKVIAADLQQGMLDIVESKIRNTNLRIQLHKTEQQKTGITEKADFILLFYTVHELPDQQNFFMQMKQITKPSGKILIVEPPFHVNEKAFRKTLKKARQAGFTEHPGPKMLLSRTAVLAN